MKNYLIYLIFIAVLCSCGDNALDESDLSISISDANHSSEEKDLTKINLVGLKDTIDYVYHEWYPGRNQVKIEGPMDKKYRRQGKWVFFNAFGEEISMTTYTHGLRQGFSIVKHPNGAIYYRGEYDQDRKVGLWTFYDEKGKRVKEINYDNK